MSTHGWEKRQFKSDTSTDRVKRFRQRSSNVAVTVDVTAPDTDTDTDTETDTKKRKNIQKEKKISRSASLAEFDIFWNEYPRRVGKGSAVKAFERAMTKTDAKTITDGLDRWKRSKDFPTEERFIPHAATWLNAERWLDIPAETTSGYKIYTEEDKVHPDRNFATQITHDEIYLIIYGSETTNGHSSMVE